ncbi:MAG: helix-turn-helix transcriptional regulator [Acidimicrobiales bacterium]|nr:helix-turn-helix transcriptional regulator [Acidimicrobiales bacterium]
MRSDELGDFLRSRRERLRPADVGLPPGSGRRAEGLRREEVAVLSGVGVSWLTRLEQGRANRVSADVLDGLAGALRLTAPERAHLYDLADLHPPAPVVAGQVGDESQQVLVRGLHPNPAYVLDHAWNLVCWNRAQAELFPVIEERASPPNLLRLTLETESLRTFMTDWDDEVRRLASQFRLHLGRFPSDEGRALVDELRADHPAFDAAWRAREVAVFSPKVRRFDHPTTGEVALHHHRLALPDHPGWTVVVYTPVG